MIRLAPIAALVLFAAPASAQDLQVWIRADFESESGAPPAHLEWIEPGATTVEVRTVVPEPPAATQPTRFDYTLDPIRTTLSGGLRVGIPELPSTPLTVVDDPVAGDALRFDFSFDEGHAIQPATTSRMQVDLSGPATWFVTPDLRAMVGATINLTNSTTATLTVTHAPSGYSAVARATRLFVVDGPSGPTGVLCLADGSPDPYVGQVPCPCGNDPAPGSGEGCRNSSGSGAVLTLRGSTSFAAGNLGFTVRQGAPNQPAFLLEMTRYIKAPFRSGLLCAGAPGRLVEAFPLDASGFGSTSSNVIANGTAPAPGAWRIYQVAYRDTQHGSCLTAANFTPAIGVRFQ